MMKRILLALVVVVCLASVGHADSVGWNFVHQWWSGDYTLGATETAGFTGYEQGNWNNHVSNAQGPGAVPLNNLADDGGAATTISVTAWTQSAANSWHMGDTGSPNARLISDFADKEPSIRFSNIGSTYTDPGYAVVVYYSNNEGPSQSSLSITGSVDDSATRAIITGNTGQVAYSNVGWVEETGVLAGPTNVTVFEGLTDPEFTVALTGNNNNGISAVQIVSGSAPPPPPPPAKAIGVNYVNGAFGTATLGSAQTAGFLLAQENWNNVVGVGQGPPTAPVNDLLDENGNPTTTDITAWTLSANNSWTVSGSDDPQNKLTRDFNDREPSITFAEIPFDEYAVVVHYNNNEGPSTSTLTLTGSVDDLLSRAITTGNTPNTRWDENGYIEEDGTGVGPSNVTVFTGLNDPGFTISLAGTNNNGISAIQIVSTAPEGEVPEPATVVMVLLGLGSLAGAARRRRRA